RKAPSWMRPPKVASDTSPDATGEPLEPVGDRMNVPHSERRRQPFRREIVLGQRLLLGFCGGDEEPGLEMIDGVAEPAELRLEVLGRLAIEGQGVPVRFK